MTTDNKFVMSDALSSAFTTLKTYFDNLVARIEALETSQQKTSRVFQIVLLENDGQITPGPEFNRQCNDVYTNLSSWPTVILYIVSNASDPNNAQLLSLPISSLETNNEPGSSLHLKMCFTKTVALEYPTRIEIEREFHIAGYGDEWELTIIPEQ